MFLKICIPTKTAMWHIIKKYFLIEIIILRITRITSLHTFTYPCVSSVPGQYWSETFCADALRLA